QGFVHGGRCWSAPLLPSPGRQNLDRPSPVARLGRAIHLSLTSVCESLARPQIALRPPVLCGRPCGGRGTRVDCGTPGVAGFWSDTDLAEPTHLASFPSCWVPVSSCNECEGHRRA